MKKSLRAYQQKAVDDVRQSILDMRHAEIPPRTIIQAPTGAGKTIISSKIVGSVLSRGRRAVFCAPAISLIDQTVEKFYHEGIRDVGVIQANHYLTDWSKPIQVASVQTLMRRGLPDVDLVMIDEAHRMFKFITEWMAHEDWQHVPFIGLSATPWARGMGLHWNKLIVAETIKGLIRQGYLSPFRVFAPSSPDLSGVKTVAGDYHEKQLAEAMNRADLVADIVSTWIEIGEGRPTICFCVDRAHAKSVQEDFVASGVPCGYIDAKTELADRKQIEKQLERGEIKVVASVGCLIIGVDWPFVSCVIWARPTKSKMLFVQGTGRGLRICEGKTDCLILDHSDNHDRLGFVTDIHQSRLDMRDVGERKDPNEVEHVRLPKQCPKCDYLRPAGEQTCPNCGFTPEPQSEVEVEDGELVEITPGGKGKKKKAAPSPDERQHWYSSFVSIGIDRGYNSGWAKNKFNEKFKEWPTGLHDFPEEPSAAVRSWVRYSQIKWAKRRKTE